MNRDSYFSQTISLNVSQVFVFCFCISDNYNECFRIVQKIVLPSASQTQRNAIWHFRNKSQFMGENRSPVELQGELREAKVLEHPLRVSENSNCTADIGQ